MKKKAIIGLLMVWVALLLGGCRNEAGAANFEKTKEGGIKSEEARVSVKPMETVRLSEEKELPSGEKYGIKYNLKINPEFDIYADNELLVVGVQALNADAEDLLEIIDIIGMDVVSAVDYVVSESRTRGYMTEEKGNTVDLSIVEINETVMEECDECGGCGTVLCEDCKGNPFLTCQVCGGEKTHICEHCKGSNRPDLSDKEMGPVPCHVCNGTLWIDCERCNGTGRGPINCSHCNGTGACDACSGSGYIDVTAGGGADAGKVVGTDACYRCHGSGICQNCKGTSDTYCPNCCEHNGPDGTIRNPGGIPGKEMCRECNGTGLENRGANAEAGESEENCEYCNGSGYLLCEACGGTGGHMCSCELNGYRWCGSCHGSGVRTK